MYPLDLLFCHVVLSNTLIVYISRKHVYAIDSLSFYDNVQKIKCKKQIKPKSVSANIVSYSFFPLFPESLHDDVAVAVAVAVVEEPPGSELTKPGIGVRFSEYCGGNSTGSIVSSISVCMIMPCAGMGDCLSLVLSLFVYADMTDCSPLIGLPSFWC